MHSATQRLYGLLPSLLLTGLMACGDSDSAVVGIGDEPGFGFTPGKALPLKDGGDWQWFDIEGAYCQDGSNTGIFVQKGSVDRLVIYFQGGGACFNEQICDLNPQMFNEEIGVAKRDSINVMNDKTPGNPFKNWSKVFVGYCSGDIYSGIRTKGTGFGGRTQQGFTNVGLFLERLVPTFTDVDDVVLTGASAGGFGALFNWLRVQEAFNEIKVTLVDDSGPPLDNEFVTPCFQKQVGQLWGWDKTLPPGCKDCDKGIAAIMPYYLSTFPDHRIGMLSYTQDSTIRFFFGFGLNECKPDLPNIAEEDYERAVKQLRDSLSSYENFALWTKTGSSHTFLISEDLEQKADGVKLGNWLSGVIDGGETFKNVGP